MVHSDAIQNGVLEVGIAEKSTEAKWCIRVLFKECG